MRESRTSGSVRGDRGNPVPYRDKYCAACLLVCLIARQLQSGNCTLTLHMLIWRLLPSWRTTPLRHVRVIRA